MQIDSNLAFNCTSLLDLLCYVLVRISLFKHLVLLNLHLYSRLVFPSLFFFFSFSFTWKFKKTKKSLGTWDLIFLHSHKLYGNPHYTSRCVGTYVLFSICGRAWMKQLPMSTMSRSFISFKALIFWWHAIF